MTTNRRAWMHQTLAATAGLAALGGGPVSEAAASSKRDGLGPSPLTMTRVTITPIALPDPPLLAAGGCHGPYFLRNIVEIETDAGIIGVGETKGGSDRLAGLQRAQQVVVGRNAFAYRSFAAALSEIDPAVYAGIELACLDACGKATGLRVCELLGGPVREEVEFSAYLFYRYAADHPQALMDDRLVDKRGRGDDALDDWGEVRTAAAMAEMAVKFQKRWGFRNFKLKAGVLPPGVELETMRMMNERFGGKYPLRIDPNARWTVETALRIGRQLQGFPLEYYEDPVSGQRAMAEVRRKSGLVMSTNMCVTRFPHVKPAVQIEPIDVVLGDHHGWGGLTGFQELGRICETVGWKMSQHSNNHAGITMAAMVHAGAVTPQLRLASDTHYVWLPEGADVIEGANIPIKEGKIRVPTGAGLGVTLDRDKLARAHETYQKSGMRDRDDAATMQRFEPGWKRTLF